MSRSSLVHGGGPRGVQLILDCVPDSTFKLEIDDFVAAKTVMVGKFVQLSFGANYEVTSPADGERADGIIVAEPVSDPINSTYRISCDIWSFTDDNGNIYAANRIIHAPYSGTLALHNSCEVESTSTFYQFADGATDGFHNAVIAIDVPASGYCDVIHD